MNLRKLFLSLLAGLSLTSNINLEAKRGRLDFFYQHPVLIGLYCATVCASIWLINPGPEPEKQGIFVVKKIKRRNSL